MIAYPTPAAVLAVSITLTLLCTLVVVLRLLLRRWHKDKLLVDDWLCLAALIITIGMAIAIVVGVAQKSLAYPTPPEGRGNEPHSIQVEKTEWAVQLIQCLQLGFTKLSFIMLFRRLFVTSKKNAFSIATWVMAALVIGWTIAFFIAFLFACRVHINQWWLKPQTCLLTRRLGYENAWVLSECLMDCMIILMPLPMIWSLRLTLQRKIAVTSVFALGALAVVVSVIRVVIFYQAKSVDWHEDIDHDLLITTFLLWSLIESTIALIAACLPVLYGLLRLDDIDSIGRKLQSLRRHIRRRKDSQRLADDRTDHDDDHPMQSKLKSKSALERRRSDASKASILPFGMKPNPTFSFSVRDQDSARDVRDVPKGRICVRKAITQTESPV